MSHVGHSCVGEELLALFNGIIVNLLLSGLHPDSLEDFSTESLSCNGSNNIDSILLFLYIVAPCQEYVLLLWHVCVVQLSSHEHFESMFKVSLILILLVNCILLPLVECVDVLRLSLEHLSSLLGKVSADVLFLFFLCLQLILDVTTVVVSPCSETLGQLRLAPECQELAKDSPLSIEVGGALLPGVEAFLDLVLCHPNHIVSNHFL